MSHFEQTRSTRTSYSPRAMTQSSTQPLQPALIECFAQGEHRAVLTFAGQGFACMDTLVQLYRDHLSLRPWIQAASQALNQLVEHTQCFQWSGLYAHGFDLQRWLESPSTRPSADMLTSSAMSQPLIFITQIAQYLALYEEGLHRVFDAGGIVGLSGHSQGMMAALLIAEGDQGKPNMSRFVAYVQYFAYQGLYMAQAFDSACAPVDEEYTTMASIAGMTRQTLTEALDIFNGSLPENQRLHITIGNTRTRHVVSGPSLSMRLFHERLEQRAQSELKQRKAGKHGGSVLSFVWENLVVGAPFHSPYMRPGLEQMRDTITKIGFEVRASNLTLPVYSPADGQLLNQSKDLTHELMTAQFVRSVEWKRTVEAFLPTDADFIFDLGPGDGVARLTRSILKGYPIHVLALTQPQDHQLLFTQGASLPQTPVDYRDFLPQLVTLPGGDISVLNRYTRATGHSPVILPGMTPTTADVDIVAAAANAGHTAELAGGGQVTQEIFERRIEELQQKLKPGREVVFNALYLDPYLWGLHLGRERLVQKARAAGAPICGVTISAGIPDADEAAALLRQLNALDMWLNAFKPGTIAQVKQVLAIAQRVPELTVFMHLEGGKAGGHHSWEDLDVLLLETYHRIRSTPNVVLCVGGGIATTSRAVALLSGQWARAYDQPLMPVDAVLLGTLTMACQEALTSESVKRALAEVAGCTNWVHFGEQVGQMTSGRSQLNADIHYIDNAAARCGRLLDEVAGDAELVSRHRAKIIDALNATAKPYFGDLDTMTYADVARRLVALMAIGQHGRYEDGCWLDRSWRQRVAMWLERAQARLSEQDSGQLESLMDSTLRCLDDPSMVLAQFNQALPHWSTTTLHPVDVHFFIDELCRLPGKPVNFVPVIDADVRRWYKSDSLWQAHDDRYDANQVLIIPGPEAVAGLTTINEPIAALFGRFNAALSETLTRTQQVQPTTPLRLSSLPQGITLSRRGQTTILSAAMPAHDDVWFEYISRCFHGPVAALFGARRLQVGHRSVPNPVRQLALARVEASMMIVSQDGLASQIIYRHQSARITVERVDASLLQVQLADGEDVLTLPLSIHQEDVMTCYSMSSEHYAGALSAFYCQVLFGEDKPAVKPFEWVERKGVVFSFERLRAYGALTGAPGEQLPHNVLFSMSWDALFPLLCDSSLADGLLKLVHQSHRIEQLEGWPLDVDCEASVKARLTRLEHTPNGCIVDAVATISQSTRKVARLHERFFIRGKDLRDHGVLLRRVDDRMMTFEVQDEGQRALLASLPWLTWTQAPNVGETLRLSVHVSEVIDVDGNRQHRAHGHVDCIIGGDVRVGDIALDCQGRQNHPVDALLDTLERVRDEGGDSNVAPKTLAKQTVFAPPSMVAFAEVSCDLNPIHRSAFFAQLANLDAPIVHGMWGAARIWSFARTFLAQNDASRIVAFQTSFFAPIALGEAIELIATRKAVREGQLIVEVTASVLRDEQWVPATRATVTLMAPKTAYVFPGQGIQQRNMGMQGYAQSRAAKSVWDRADAFTKDVLGFSILSIVRDNPKEIWVNGQSWMHPKGVLNLTQFTQVAMAVLAQSQVAQLREASVFVEDAIACGHSVGEYNALGAVIGVLPLEDVIDIVYQRGITMHTLVKRDELGRSAYKMGVIRPHYAGLDHEAAERLVRQVARESGQFIQIVNYNVIGRQYSVTGHVDALAYLAQQLEMRVPEGGKPAWIEVPGIDVPFHSEILRDGVDAFRETLRTRLPEVIDASRLVGRYIPNLVPKPFCLSREMIEEIVELTQTQVLIDVLDEYEHWIGQPNALARVMLIELLAWQFASPVRWIETQDLLLKDTVRGGLSLDHVVEVGVGYQPTLANMARYSAKLLKLGQASPVIVNVEAEREVVFLQDEDPVEVLDMEDTTGEVVSDDANVHAAPVAQMPTVEIEDRPVRVSEALVSVLAIQARMRPDQIRMDETIDELFDGVSSKRNQVLMDIGQEFKLPAIDGAHEKPLSALAQEITQRAKSWQYPGPYLNVTLNEAFNRVLGRAGVQRRDVQAWLAEDYGLGEGFTSLTLNTLMLAVRDGDSARGGALGVLAQSLPTNAKAARTWLEQVVGLVAKQTGLALGKRQRATASASVDAGALTALDEKLTGPQGILMETARALVSALGHQMDDSAMDDDASTQAERLALYDAEHGAEYEKLIAPKFKAQRVMSLTSCWAFAQRDVARLAMDVLADRRVICQDEVARLATFAGDVRVAQTAAWYAKIAQQRGHAALQTALEAIARGEVLSPSRSISTVPELTIDDTGQTHYSEVPSSTSLVAALWPYGESPKVNLDGFDEAFKTLLLRQQTEVLSFASQTAFVTGASPGSIALSMVGRLLRGGARVVVGTTTTTPERMQFYKRFYQAHAVPGAQLHVVPFNQASQQDTDALVEWLFGEVTEQSGATIRVLKRPFAPSLILPFGAMKDLGTLDLMDIRAQAVVRAMLLGVERLLMSIASRYVQQGISSERCHVVLPLSPNHGGFGGDGVYAETKLGLEALLHKWHSEQDAWGRALSLCGAKIGWVRGTGLMDANNPIAAQLETHTSVKTFNTQEMGLMLTTLCHDDARAFSRRRPLYADLTGGFGDLEDIKGTVDAMRALIEEASTHTQLIHHQRAQYEAALGQYVQTTQHVQALPTWPLSLTDDTQDVPDVPAVTGSLEDVVVIVGAGELGPCGRSTTRFELEVEGKLSTAGILELAWMTGLVRYEHDGRRGQWIDVEDDQPIEEHQLADVLTERVMSRVGLRFIDPDSSTYDPNALQVYTTVYVERDMVFHVNTEDEARAFYAADPQYTRIAFDEQSHTWRVTRLAGAEIRVPKQARLARQVAGLIPNGFDFSRFGLPADMIQNVDKVTLFNLVATVDAFVSAGITPEQLLQWIHPARVANTQGSGIGGMESLRRLYTDHLLGKARQNDALQETLINVVAAYVVQSYVGSYGPMSHPVAACATAAVSLEEGADKILAGKADFAVTGGFDDIGCAGAIGFADMSATADSDVMLEMGLEPHQMSRANDSRRRGFVESQGGGTILLARGDVALKMGLPVLGVVAWAGSFGDGIHKSIPAPGLGALAAASGGAESPLGRALSRFGLTADDIAVVYKHDTSTAANDPNENALHQDIQCTLGRTPGNPLWVVSQKTLTGHPKGGAAAWQIIGLCQAMNRGYIPGNRNLDDVDAAMKQYAHMTFTDVSLKLPEDMPIRAGLVTSLGFGHVSAISLILHPSSFVSMIPPEARQSWLEASTSKMKAQTAFWSNVMLGQRDAFERRTHRRFEAPDGSVCQGRQERQMLLNPKARLGKDGIFVDGASS